MSDTRSMPRKCGLADVYKIADRYVCAKCGKAMPEGYAARVLAYAGARELQALERRQAPNVELTGKAGLPDLSGRTQG